MSTAARRVVIKANGKIYRIMRLSDRVARRKAMGRLIRLL